MIVSQTLENVQDVDFSETRFSQGKRGGVKVVYWLYDF